MVPKVFSKLADEAQRQEYIQCYLFQDCLQPALNSIKTNKQTNVSLCHGWGYTQNKHSSDTKSSKLSNIWCLNSITTVLSIGLEMPFITIKQK